MTTKKLCARSMCDDPEYLSDAKLEQFERFFAALAPGLEAFAQRYNLRIEKYHRAQPCWSFHFRLNNVGARGHLQVHKVDDRQVFISGHRERVDPEGTSRFVDGGAIGMVKLSTADPQFTEQLYSMLVKIVDYPEAEMVSDGFERYHAQRGREQRDIVCRLLMAEPLVRLE